MLNAGMKVSVVPILQMRKSSLCKSPKSTQKVNDRTGVQPALSGSKAQIRTRYLTLSPSLDTQGPAPGN